MFSKLDEYLSVIKDPEVPIDQRIKRYQMATKRMTKIKNELEHMHKDISEYEPCVTTDEKNDVNISWDKAAEKCIGIYNQFV